MKNLIEFVILFGVLFFGVFIGMVIANDINRDNNRIKELSSLVIEKQRDNLKTELKALKVKERYGITVADTTLFIVRKLKIGQENEKVLDTRTIHKGKNHYFIELRENTDLEMWINRY